MDTFNFVIEQQQIGSSSTIINTNGARGLQLMLGVGSGGDDDNKINVSIVAISDDNSLSQECVRVGGFDVENSDVIILYPGIGVVDTNTAKSVSFVLPAKFQVQISTVMGLPFDATVFGTLLV